MALLKIKPHITEKTLLLAKSGQFVFLVPSKSTKPQIAHTVNQLFKVDVVKINTSIKKSVKSRSGRTGRAVSTKIIKKAILKLKDKQTIKLFETKK